MVSRNRRRIRRLVVCALASLFAASVPWVVAPANMGGIAPAFAETAKAKTPASTEAPRGSKAKRKAKKSGRSRGADGPETKASAKRSPPKSTKDRTQKHKSHASKDKKGKKTASRTAGKKRSGNGKKRGDKNAPRTPCFGPAVTIDRGGLETETFPLVDCAGTPLQDSRQRLSILARPWGRPRPSGTLANGTSKDKTRAGKKSAHKQQADKQAGHKQDETASDEIAPGVRLLDLGLVRRLDKIARKYPGKILSLVSGYRPQSQGSLHQSARAVDLRVTGVDNSDLVAFCRTLADTGCGFYPNSTFVHVDARLPGTGAVTWIDVSGPGEPPHYVTQWPPPEDDGPAIRVAGGERSELAGDPELGDPSDSQADETTEAASATAKPASAAVARAAEPQPCQVDAAGSTAPAPAP